MSHLNFMVIKTYTHTDRWLRPQIKPTSNHHTGLSYKYCIGFGGMMKTMRMESVTTKNQIRSCDFAFLRWRKLWLLFKNVHMFSNPRWHNVLTKRAHVGSLQFPLNVTSRRKWFSSSIAIPPLWLILQPLCVYIYIYC